MSITTNAQRDRLTSFAFRELFINPGMGWDNPTAGPLNILEGGQSYTFERIAEKVGVQVFAGGWDANGAIPNYQLRRRLQRQISKQAHENLIIFTDAAKTEQIWHWIKKEPGQPTRARERWFRKGQSGEPILQALEGIRFSLDEEDELTIIGATEKLGRAFDKDKVTKKFYEQFKSQHDAFIGFTEGIPGEDDQKWYASVMLNRLMFLYFFQQKGFLDNNPRYLQSKLQQVQRLKGRDQFHGFYRHFLRRLFHEGLAQTADTRPSDVDALIGEIPYLNGGIFDEHQLEQAYPDIDIPDEAFEKLFAFFDQYTWHLDERPIANQNEINPDVLGYIFEKYINQKELGAYYTKEDITEYICKNTIIPFLFDAAKMDVANAFKPGSYLWRLLQENPDDYIYEAVAKGADLALPPNISAGINDVSQRSEWNRPAAAEFSLPTETWREHIARRKRRDEVWARIVDGGITEINDLITLNLDIRRFAEDVIRNTEGPELLRAYYKAITSISVLDPTCGSGAFLFAGLNILEPLYDACLDRMQQFVDSLSLETEKPHPEKFRDFRETLSKVNNHPNRRYFILKQIILNNLYGTDIVEEAVEICKLRLFLKLVAQISDKSQIEPLPDIDFNIRCGNALVGFVRAEDVKRAITPVGIDRATGKQMHQKGFALDYDDEFRRIEDAASLADKAFQRFHEMQSLGGLGGGAFRGAKEDLESRLDELRAELNGYLARDYAVTPDSNNPKYKDWLTSHQPFHWFAEFFGVMQQGGFDVIIGNPPYVEYSQSRNIYSLRGYQSLASGNLYAFVTERSLDLLGSNCRFGMIVPLSFATTSRAQTLQRLVVRHKVHLSHYSGDRNLAEMFTGVKMRLTIILLKNDSSGQAWSTNYMKWFTRARSTLFDLISYGPTQLEEGTIPKLSSKVELAIRDKMLRGSQSLGSFLTAQNFGCYYHNAPIHWVRAFNFMPLYESERYGRQPGSHYKRIALSDETETLGAVAVLNSSLFYWYFVSVSNCRDLTARDIDAFPIMFGSDESWTALAGCCLELMSKYKEIATIVETTYASTGHVRYEQIDTKRCKTLIDRIDQELGRNYSFSDEELDFVLNYDTKFRLGSDSDV